jgi:magnesium transporter
MIQLLGPGEDSLTTVALEDIRNSVPVLTGALWIDLFQPTEEEELFVEKTLGVDLPSREEMHEIAESSRLFEEKDSLYLSCWLLCYDSPIPLNSSVSFVITAKQFVSIRYSDHHAFRIFQKTRNRLQSRRFQTHYGAFVELLDAMAGHIASTLRLVEQDLNSLSVEIFSEQKAQQKKNKLGLKRIVQRLGKRNSLVSGLRESSLSLSTLTPFFVNFAGTSLKPHVAAQLKSLERDIKSLRQYDTELSAEISFLLDSTVGLINFEQNQSMKILSVAAVLLALI